MSNGPKVKEEYTGFRLFTTGQRVYKFIIWGSDYMNSRETKFRSDQDAQRLLQANIGKIHFIV